MINQNKDTDRHKINNNRDDINTLETIHETYYQGDPKTTWYTLTGAYANVDTTTMKVELPEKGIYWVYADIVVNTDGTANTYAKCRLYDNTKSQVVTNPNRHLIWNRVAVSELEIPVFHKWLVSVDIPTVLYLQAFRGGSASVTKVGGDGLSGSYMGYWRII